MKGICFFDLMPDVKTGEETDITEVQLMKAGKFKYFDDTEMDISTDVLRQMKTNFDAKIKKVELAVDYFHASYAEAAGWIEDVILKEGDTQLWIKVDWTEKAKFMIKEREVRYLSADFDIDYQDNETGERHGYTLNGAGLTNRPFIKGMDAIFSELDKKTRDKLETLVQDGVILFQNKDEKGHKQMEFSEIKKEVFALSESEKAELAKICGGNDEAVKLSEENKTLQADLDTSKKEVVKLSGELSGLKKEQEFSVLLSEGKAVEAQKEAFMKGDMAAFVKLSVPVKFSTAGTGGAVKDDKAGSTTPQEAQAEIMKLSDEMAAEKKITFSQASAIVLEQNKQLAELAAKI